jgi:hypothetical protein
MSLNCNRIEAESLLGRALQLLQANPPKTAETGGGAPAARAECVTLPKCSQVQHCYCEFRTEALLEL